ncbi:MAG TPA: cupin domain-containing protein [Syntrophales bacterium]|nr:cupin domain-containing protein [Syntrophales bacterium]
MIRRSNEMREQHIHKLKEGKGTVKLFHLLEKEELSGKGRLCAREVIEPGSSVGYHRHEGDFELYYVLEGEGVLNDNGFKTTVKKGDVVRTGNGEFHSIENVGDKNVELIAIILFE